MQSTDKKTDEFVQRYVDILTNGGFKACEIAGFTEEKRIIYEKDMMDEKRLNGQYAAYRKMGREEGRAEGRAQGLAEAAKNMAAAGMSAEQISAILKLSQKDVESML